MRHFRFLLLFLVLLPGGAWAQAVAQHSGAAPAKPAAPAAPAAPPAPKAVIIPGSPLAALTGAGATPPPPQPHPEKKPAAMPARSPYGTGSLGLSLTGVLGADAARTLATFIGAVRRSTALTPVVAWVRDSVQNPAQIAALEDILTGLALVILPAIALDVLLRIALRPVRRTLAARAMLRVPLNAPADEAVPAAEALAAQPRRRQRLRDAATRLLRALMMLGLRLVPLVGFALLAAVLLGTSLIQTHVTRLAIVGTSNAWLVCRLILEAARFLFAPRYPALRLVPMPDGRARRILLWLHVLLTTVAGGYVLVSLCELLGLEPAGTMVLTRLVALVAHIEAAIIVWESRHVVGRWIAGDRTRRTPFAILRHRLGAIWHFLALFYILALWVAWVGEVRHAFGYLLRVVVILAAAAALGRAAWSGTGYGLDRLLPEDRIEKSRHATVLARLRAYAPLLRIGFRVAILAIVAFAILQGLGFGIFHYLMRDRFTRILVNALIGILVTIVIALLVWEFANAIINNRIDRLTEAGRTRNAARLRTLVPMLQATIGVPIALVTGLICLSKIGVDAAPLLAGAGVLGIAVGFGSQKLVQDIITGLFLLLEDAMQVGDVVNLASMQGTVEKLSIRTIRLRGIDGSMNIIPFSAVTTVTNLTRDFSLAQVSVQVQYDADLDKVYAVLSGISKDMRGDKKWGPMMRDDLQIFGLDQFGASALVITGQIRTGPGQHWAVRREFNARVKTRFEAERIEIPYTYLPPAPEPQK